MDTRLNYKIPNPNPNPNPKQNATVEEETQNVSDQNRVVEEEEKKDIPNVSDETGVTNTFHTDEEGSAPVLHFVDPAVKQEEFIYTMYTKYSRGINARETYNKTRDGIRGMSIATSIILGTLLLLCFLCCVIAFFKFDISQWARLIGSGIVIACIIIFCKKTNIM
jgi:hypothetical protein